MNSESSKQKQAFVLISLAGIFLALFACLTALLLNYDLGAVGPENSVVGFSTVNKFIFDKLGQNDFWYKLTELMGYLAIAVALGFAAYTAIELFRQKSIKKLDVDLSVLIIFYIIVALVYLVFEKALINYRPILVDGKLEASYPSSHTLLTVFIMVTTIVQLLNRLRNRAVKAVSIAVAVAIAVMVPVGRLLSGVHWFTDVLGGVFLGLALSLCYAAFCKGIPHCD